MEYGKAFFARLFAARQKAAVCRDFQNREPFLLLLSVMKEEGTDAGVPHAPLSKKNRQNRKRSSAFYLI